MQVNVDPPWHKQFWPWFVLSLPATAIIASVATIAISIRYSDSLVNDDYYQQGLAINNQLQKQQLARDLGLTFDLVIARERKEMSVDLHNPRGIVVPAMLQLTLIHPFDSRFDMSFPLQLDARSQRYRQTFSSLPENINWSIELSPIPLAEEHDDAWKLRAKFRERHPEEN